MTTNQNKSWKRYLRSLLLILVLLVALAAYYYRIQNAVRFEVVQFKSNLVGKVLPYGVVLPPGYFLITSRRIHYPVLYLLHGWRGDYSSWTKQTALIQYAAEYQMIVITPEGGNGWYTDSATVPSDQYEAYVVRELITDVDSRFRTIRGPPGAQHCRRFDGGLWSPEVRLQISGEVFPGGLHEWSS
ncbi:MAG: hypothetical protein H0V18_02665 [Pyrinomonadaceae bacterium]|nr:hypothetical protein [Pyrinomonadaceae bacterium]